MTSEKGEEFIKELVFEIAKELGLEIRGYWWDLIGEQKPQPGYTGPYRNVHRLRLDGSSWQCYIGFTDEERQDANQRSTVEARIRRALGKLDN